MTQIRKQHSAAFKAQIVLEALREARTIAQIASEHQIHPNLVTKWKQEALAELPTLFERKDSQTRAQEAQEQKTAQLYEQIGRLTTQVNWLKKKSGLILSILQPGATTSGPGVLDPSCRSCRAKPTDETDQ